MDGEFGDKCLGELMGKLIGTDPGILIYIFWEGGGYLDDDYEGMEGREGELITRRKGRKG